MTSLINLSEQNQIENPTQPASFTNESITNKPQVGVHTRRRASTLADAQNVTQQQSVPTRRTRANNLTDSRAGAQPKYKQSPPTISAESTTKSPLEAFHERRKRERINHDREVINPTLVENDNPIQRGANQHPTRTGVRRGNWDYFPRLTQEHHASSNEDGASSNEDEGDWEKCDFPQPNSYGFSQEDNPTLEDLQQIHDIELQEHQQRTIDQQHKHEQA